MIYYHLVGYYPSEIEEVISQMPSVADVCVLAVYNEDAENEAGAVVDKIGSNLEAQDAIDYVRNHVEDKFKHLNAGVLIADELKHSPNGKTNRIATKAYFLKVKEHNV